MKKQHGIAILIGATSLLLSACGGGGGGGGSTPATATSVGYTGETAAVTIADPAAADTIAAATISSAMNMDIAGSIPYLKAGSTATNSNKIADLTKRLMDRAMSLPKPADTTLAGVTDTFTDYCYYSGTITYTETYANASAATPGDSFSLAFNSCDDGYGYVMTGSFGATLLSYTDSNNMSVSVNFSSLRESSTSNTDYTLFNGGLNMTMSYNSVTSIEGNSITGDALLYDVSYGGVSYSQALTNFSLVDSYDWNNYTTTVDHDYTFYSTSIGGSIRVDTTTPIVFASGAYYPNQGVVVITGANDAKVRLTAQSDATNVFIEYDIDPIDGVYETSQTVTWSYLESL